MSNNTKRNIEHDETNDKKIKLQNIETEINDHNVTIFYGNKRKCHLYENKIILAPMVRVNSLPFRLLCLRHGADLVYSEELVDHRVVTCKRVENELLGTIDFIDKDNRVIFRTCPEERDRVVFQLGSSDPERALNAALLVADDVMGIDFNFGCPKKFSIAGGMGAALLEEPGKIRQLLTNCVENLNIPVTCKIRLLPELSETLKLVKLIESCGVSAIAVHGRTKDQRPRHENNIEALKEISKIVKIPVIANGESNNLRNYSDVIKFRQESNCSSVMLARVAMKNPAIFRQYNQVDSSPVINMTLSHDKIDRETINVMKHANLEKHVEDHGNETSESQEIVTRDGDALVTDGETTTNSGNEDLTPITTDNNTTNPIDTNGVIAEYLELALKFNNHPSNVKYSLQSLMANCGRRSKEFLASFHSAKDVRTICDLFKLNSSIN